MPRLASLSLPPTHASCLTSHTITPCPSPSGFTPTPPTHTQAFYDMSGGRITFTNLEGDSSRVSVYGWATLPAQRTGPAGDCRDCEWLERGVQGGLERGRGGRGWMIG